ncbi:hypothetical protein AG1IA_04773 [Rhizoctonia solani AG-1 IA]|uniref:Uncharacterized protein n=1 Tax=Thanatephorus cucumeris (strain AG1-IA) TaxID=983506 RepID=L8WWN1_THACA|nr:hypothetical protein AG1IA_04773 [Rhizoctonia solani AG-1 IA]
MNQRAQTAFWCSLITTTVDPKSADFLNVKNRALYAECWQNPTIFSMNPHPQLTPVCRRGADSAILDADVWQNLDVINQAKCQVTEYMRSRKLRFLRYDSREFLRYIKGSFRPLYPYLSTHFIPSVITRSLNAMDTYRQGRSQSLLRGTKSKYSRRIEFGYLYLRARGAGKIIKEVKWRVLWRTPESARENSESANYATIGPMGFRDQSVECPRTIDLEL